MFTDMTGSVQLQFDSEISVSQDGETSIECGSQAIPKVPFYQSAPLLPVQDPVIVSQKFSPVIKSQLRDGNMDLCRDETENGKIFHKRKLRRKQEKFKTKEKILTSAKMQLSSLADFQSYGDENMFNGSCVRVIDEFIFYTGNDGIVHIKKLSSLDQCCYFKTDANDHIENIDSCTDKSLNHTRIYSLDVRKVSNERDFLIAARYRYGVTYWTFNGTSCKQISSFVNHDGYFGSVFTTDTDICVLDKTSRIHLFDVQTNQCKYSKLAAVESNEYSWAVLSAGMGPNSVCVGTRKFVNLIDIRIRSHNLTSIDSLDESTYLRDMKTVLPNLFVTTDQHLKIFDLRNTKQCQQVPLNFSSYSIVHGFEHFMINRQNWCLTSTKEGDMSMTVLDLTHKHCEDPIDEKIKVRCTSGAKRSDFIGRGSKMLKGWKYSVMQFRNNPQVRVQQYIEKRFNVGFCGAAVTYDSSKVRAFLVNAVGDLFCSDLRLDGDYETPLFESEVECQDEDISEILDSWAAKFYNITFQKKSLVRKIFEDESESREKCLDTPILSDSKREEAGLNSCKQVEDTQDDYETSTQHFIKFAEYCDNSVEDNIYKCLMNGQSISEDVSECWNEMDFSSGDTRLPQEEDRNFSLRNYLESETLPDVDDPDISLYL